MDSTQNNKNLLIITVAITVIGILMYFNIYRCPWDLFFGVPCPLCGATRAMMCLITGRFADAFYFHPLWPLILIAGIVFIMYNARIIRLKQATADAMACFLAAVLMLCFVIRHIIGSPVVAVHCRDSLLYRLINVIF